MKPAQRVHGGALAQIARAVLCAGFLVQSLAVAAPGSPEAARGAHAGRGKDLRATATVRSGLAQPVSLARGHRESARKLTAGKAAPGAFSQSAPQAPRIWLDEAKRFSATFVGGGSGTENGPTKAQNNALALLLGAGQAEPLSLAKGDFDQDGVEDLVVGYKTSIGGALVLYRGNLDALAPQSDISFEAIGRGEFAAPFLLEARVFSVPVAPDFIAAGNFTGSGNTDLVVASRGGNALYVFPGDGKGNFAAPQVIRLTGAVSAMAAGPLGVSRKFETLIVGIAGPNSSFGLAVFKGSVEGLAAVETFSLSAPVSNINFGDFGDVGMDSAFLAGGHVMLLHGSSMQLEKLPLEVSAKALVVGSFLDDRNPGQQMALLTSDGAMQIAVRNEFDPRAFTAAEMQAVKTDVMRGRPHFLLPARSAPTQGWKIAESIPSVTPVDAGHVPVVFRTRISSNGSDDIMVLGALAGQMAVISHPNVQAGATTFAQGAVSLRPYSGTPVAALPMRVNIDGRPGVVALDQRQVAPAVFMPLPDPTFFVNRFDDPTPTSPIANACNNTSSADLSSSCSLREAVLKANSIAGTDTVQVPAGTITLSLPRIANNFTGNQGTIEVTDSVNIVGQVDGGGNPISIIQGGTSAATGVDKVFSFNEDITAFTTASVSLSNLVIRFGHNRGNTTIQDGWGGAFDFDTGGTSAATATATVTVTNCLITDNTLTEGEGGGIAIFNTNGGTGGVTINSSTIQNNVTAPSAPGTAGNGGGVFVAVAANLVLNNSRVLNNSANTNGTHNPAGGGLELLGQPPITGHVAIHGSTISGNHAGGQGGGIFNNSNLLIDSSSVIANNTSGTQGGGLFHDSLAPDTATLTKVTITGNTASVGGGGIFVGNLSTTDTLTMHFSRLAANSAPSGSNLDNVHSTLNVTDNWWGANNPSATINNASGGVSTFDPFIQLTHTASPAKIRINQSATLTGDISADNHGVGTALAGNLDVLAALPITFNNPNLGTIPQAEPEALNVSAQATATYNAGGVGGAGQADATVDQQTVTAPIIVLQPPSITESFNPTTVAVNTPSTITFTVVNGNIVTINASFTDTLPTNLVVAATPNVVNGCGGTVTATARSGTISFSNPSLPVGTCTILVNVQGTTDGVFNNSVTIDSTDAGNGNTASANLTVIRPPQIAKAFGAGMIPFGGTTSLTFTVTSLNQNLTLTGTTFTDSLPTAAPGTLIVATPSNLASTCSGTAIAASGSSSVSLSGASLAPGATCTVNLTVQGTAVGAANNSVTVSDASAGTGNTSTALLTVVKANTATAVTSSQNSSVFGQSVTFTATVSAVAPGAGTQTGTVTFLDGGSPIGTGTLSGGVATFTTSAFAVGNHTITTSYGGDGNFNGSTGSLTGNPQVVNKSNTTTGVTSSQNPSVFGQSVTFIATVSAVAPGAGTQTGTVTFLDGGSSIGTGTLSGGVATFTTSALTVGSHTITTSYGGDASFNGSTASLAGNPQVVSKANSATAVTSSQNPAGFGQSVTFTATVSPVAPATGTPTGTVTFLDGGSLIGTGTLSGGVASFTTSALAAGNHTITTSYAGDASFNSSTGSLTGNPQVVNKSSSTTAVTSSPNPSIFGQSVTFSATVSAVAPGTGTPTGTVTFLDGGSPIGTGTLTAGIATFTTSALTAGNHTITTTYSGDGNFSASTGSLAGNPQVVKKANSTTAVTSSQNPSGLGQSVIFSATVLPVAPGAGTPTGTVTFLDGGSPIGTGTLSGGTATFTTSALALGSHTITASYGGDGSFNGSTGPLTGNPQVVNKDNSTTTLTSSQNPSALHQSVTFTAVIAAAPPATGTPTGTVTFLDGNSPIGTGTLSGGQATFTTSALAAGPHTITSTYGGDGTFGGSTGSLSGNPQFVVAPPAAAKAFSPSVIPPNGVSVMTVTITNPATNTSPLAGVAFADNFPANLTVANPVGLANTCGGTATASAGSSTVSLTGGTVPANGSCTVTVNVTSSLSGSYSNSVSVSSTNGGTGNAASAILAVAAPPTISKALGASTVPLNGSTSLAFTITNSNGNVGLTGLSFTDNFPTGLVVATSSILNNTCGGTATAGVGAASASLSGGTLSSSSSCAVTMSVTGVTAGVKTNSVQVTSTNGGTGNTSSATVTVVAPPLDNTAFGAPSIPLNGSTSLGFTLQNNNTTQSLSGIGFTDTLPTGLLIATPNGQSGTCGGGTVTATQGTNLVRLAGATLAQGSSCTFAVNVTGTAAGQENNSTSGVTSTEGGTGTRAAASIVVVAPPTISESFTPAAVAPNTNSILSFTISSPAANTVALTGVAFSDTLPAGLIVATPNGLSGSCGGGAITAIGGSGNVVLSGATIAAGGSCTFSVNVSGNGSGTFTNTTGAVTSTNGGTGNSATANLTIASAPSITKTFGAASIGLAGSTSLSFTITNPNASLALNGVAFTDPLPAGLAVSSPNGLTGTCGSGTVTAVAGSQSISLAGGTIATSASCSFSVNVTAIAAGNQINTTGNVTSSNGGTGNAATASISVSVPDLIIVKSHIGNFFQGQTGAVYTLTVKNVGAGPTAGTVTVTDTLPTALTATALSGTGWNCNLSALACTRTDALAVGGYPPITLTVSVAANAPASLVNTAAVAGGGELNTANDSAFDSTAITPPPDFTLSVTPSTTSARAGQVANYGITVTLINGPFTNAINLAVSGLPAKSSFIFNPASVTPGQNPAASTLEILTSPGDPFLANNVETNGMPRHQAPVYSFFLPITGLLFSGLAFRNRKAGKRWLLVLLIVAGSGLGLYGCASARNLQNLGTPPGSYPVTVSATSGTVQHSITVTLVVKP